MSDTMPTSGGADSTQKYRHIEFQEHLHSSTELRLYRSYSWMKRAEEMLEAQPQHPDEAFILYWIAFNAMYAEDSAEAYENTERQNFNAYFRKVLQLDAEHKIYNMLWGRFTDEIRLFLDNKFVYDPFWKYHNGVPGYENWESRFDAERGRVHRALVSMDTRTVLSTIFNRMYVLRNQIIHGASTYRSSVNRDQVKDGVAIMSVLVPIFFDLMKENLNADWGKPYYPRLYV